MLLTECTNLIRLILEGIIAAGAFTTAIFAYKAYNHSKKSMRIQERSKRSWIVPRSLPGIIEKTEKEGKKVYKVKVYLKNYGVNPANNVKAKLFIYGSINGVMRQIIDPSVCNNPLAHNSLDNIRYDITLNNINDEYDPKFVVIVVDYLDIILNEEFKNNIFYWNTISVDEKNIYSLFEIRSEKKEKLFSILKVHNTELYKLLLK